MVYLLKLILINGLIGITLSNIHLLNYFNHITLKQAADFTASGSVDINPYVGFGPLTQTFGYGWGLDYTEVQLTQLLQQHSMEL